MLMSVYKHLGTAVYSQCLASTARPSWVCKWCVCNQISDVLRCVLLGDECTSRLWVKNTLQLETT